jgi:hypothetical protein
LNTGETMTKHKNELLSISAMARRLKRSRGTLHNWIAAGCPTHDGGRRLDVAEVEAWAIHRKRGPELRHLAKAERDTRTDAKPANSDPVAQTRAELASIAAAIEHPEGIAGAIQRLRAMEKSAFGLYADAHRGQNAEAELTRARLHSDITGHLLKAEGLRDATAELSEKLRAEYEQALVAWAEPVKGVLSTMPRELASRINPSDPAHAEIVLRDWLNGTFYPVLNKTPQHARNT